MEDRGWLAVGAGLTTQFSTDYVNSLMDEYFWPYSDSGEYDKAVATLFPHLIDEFASHIQHSPASMEARRRNGTGRRILRRWVL